MTKIVTKVFLATAIAFSLAQTAAAAGSAERFCAQRNSKWDDKLLGCNTEVGTQSETAGSHENNSGGKGDGQLHPNGGGGFKNDGPKDFKDKPKGGVPKGPKDIKA